VSNVLLGWPNYADVGPVYTPVLSGGSWNASLPLTNLQDARLAKVARSTDDAVTSTIVKADLGVARAVRVVGLPVHNFSTAAVIRVRGIAAVPILETNDFNGGANFGTPIVTTGQTDPFGGTRATLIEDDNAAGVEGKLVAVTFTGTAEKVVAVVMKAGTATQSAIGVRNAVTTLYDHAVRVSWSGGVPTVTTEPGIGSGDIFTPVALGGGWYLISFSADGVVASDSHQIACYPAGFTTTATGTAFFYEAMAWDLATQPILHDTGVVAAWPSALSVEEADGINVGYVDALSAAVTARYWRVEIADTANPDGYVELGRLFIGGGYQPTVNAAYGLKLGWGTDSTKQRTDGGAVVKQERRRYRTAMLAFENVPVDESLTGPFDLQYRMGTHEQLYFIYDPADTTHLHRRSFLATLRELTALDVASFDRNDVPFILDEEL
jgi:hypothetical protein